jgi:hypothetical protein
MDRARLHTDAGSNVSSILHVPLDIRPEHLESRFELFGQVEVILGQKALAYLREKTVLCGR